MEPNHKQHMEIQKLGLNVKKLDETTNEALSSFFMDNEANAKKKPFLTEIFKVARLEERYKNGEIGKLSYPSASERLRRPKFLVVLTSTVYRWHN